MTTVQEIIDALNKIENKTLPVFIRDTRSGMIESVSRYARVEEVSSRGDSEGDILQRLKPGDAYVSIYTGL